MIFYDGKLNSYIIIFYLLENETDFKTTAGTVDIQILITPEN